MNAPVPGWEPTTSHEPVHIPDAQGKAVAHTEWVDVPAWRDPKTGEIFLDGHAREKLEAAKARYLGILTPHQLFTMREDLEYTQSKMANLLQLGEKTWTRWETGNARPSRSMNILLSALYDGKLPVNYLQALSDPKQRSGISRWRPFIRRVEADYPDSDMQKNGRSDASSPVAA